VHKEELLSKEYAVVKERLGAIVEALVGRVYQEEHACQTSSFEE
jgi:hypothetical protein